MARGAKPGCAMAAWRTRTCNTRLPIMWATVAIHNMIGRSQEHGSGEELLVLGPEPSSFLKVEVLVLLLVVTLTSAAGKVSSAIATARRELEGTRGREEATAAADTHVLTDAVVVVIG